MLDLYILMFISGLAGAVVLVCICQICCSTQEERIWNRIMNVQRGEGEEV